jgi:hypothetical protein
VDAVSFAEASSRVAVLFRFLGIAFKFAEHDYVSKVCVCGTRGRERSERKKRKRDREHLCFWLPR